MRILWVKVGGLWPVNSGGRLRSFHILSELSRQHDITLMTTHAPGEDPRELSDQLPRCEKIISIPYVAPKWNSLRFLLVLVRSWFSRMPVDVWKYSVPDLRAEIERFLSAGAVDLCIADFLVAMPNIPDGGRTPIVHFSHNVEHMIWKRLCMLERRPWRRVLLEIEWRKMRRYEARACRKADLTIAVSAQDRGLLEANAPGARIREIATGVDVDYFAPQGTQEDPMHLVFTGSMDWHPNEDAILYFINDILPRIRRELPQVTLSVVGRNPSGQLQTVAAGAGVEVTGTVVDVRPYVDAAAVYVVPLRIGGGTRLKIFEALSMGKVVVSTSVGAEGLPLVDGQHFVRADDPASFAAAVVSLLGDQARRRALGSAGRRLTHERYAWHQVARDFGAYCEATII